MPAANGLPDPSHVAIAAGLGEQTPYLKAILAELRGELVEVGVSDAYGRELTLDQFPVAGRKRVLAYRTGNGFAAFPVPTTGVLALAANEARLGLVLINSGSVPVLLYLADQPRSGVPCVWLAAAGAWDGRFSNLLWAGNVFAVAQGAASTLTGGEL
jgi:hypothetical protein